MPAMKIKDVVEMLARAKWRKLMDGGDTRLSIDPVTLLAEVYQTSKDHLDKMIEKKYKELQENGGQE